ncbi:MAG: MxaK protein [Burkholderiaceae bacterium]|jgi:mxaK protein|nr:MxaK protein [Burkholderiaceae bacterium]
MKRRTVHIVFGVLVLCCACVTLERGWRLHQTTALNAEIARTAAAPVNAQTPLLPLRAARELRLAQALAFSHAGQHEAALKGFAGLIQNGERADPIAQQALFSLANMYLRQGMALQTGAEPLFELGKQRLRDLLRVAPQDWDARYNLERALLLAPEQQEVFSAEQQQATDRVRVRVPGFVAGDLP